MEWFAVAKKIKPALRRGDLEKCQREVEKALSRHAGSPFLLATDASITNSEQEVAAYFEDFIDRAGDKSRVGAVYAEMNGFDINPDQWYCDAFAYRAYGGSKDHDWLSRWDFDWGGNSLTITGLGPLQEVYASRAFGDLRFEESAYLSSLLVVLKFQDLIRRMAPRVRNLDFPLLATAHDYDLIDELSVKSKR